MTHIKRTFKGDEQFMMLSAYYRLNGYNPLYALRASLSILIEIPFFIAAYRYLSNCEALKGQSFLFLEDLGKADNLVKIGSFSLHLLPVIMTVINCISGFIYSKGAPVREKVQIYVLAAIFLVLLYDSPSGLVFYWILNNLFSLVKNVVQKFCKKPHIIVAIILDAVCIFVSVYFMLFKSGTGLKKKSVIYAATIFVILFPFFVRLYNKWFSKRESVFLEHKKSYFLLFLFSALGLSFLCGTTLPSLMISTSPEEFSFLGNTDSPLAYIASSLFLCLGFFTLWPLVFYLLFSSRVKYALSLVFPLTFICALANAFIFKQAYGTVNIEGELSTPSVLKEYSSLLILGPAAVFVLVAALLFFVEYKKKMHFVYLFACALWVGLLGLSVKNVISIQHEYRILLSKGGRNFVMPQDAAFETNINLSKDGKNVVVFFLDRSMGLFVPYIFEQFPELNSVYTGFTFYPNTVSFSDSTNEGMPGLYGGYEYSVDNINSRSDELLAHKSDEAQLVVPRIFSSAGWTSSLTDAQYINYGREKESSLFDSYKEIKLFWSSGRYTNKYRAHTKDFYAPPIDTLCKKKIVRFSFLQTILPIARNSYYNGGSYYALDYPSSGISKYLYFLDAYTGLYYLKETTRFDSTQNSYTMFHNATPHNVRLLKEPNYYPGTLREEELKSKNINALFPYKNVGNGESSDLAHYECNAAAFLQLAKWLNFLKENSCYDNTRIILVGDHGRGVIHYISENGKKDYFHTLLMVKDFNARGSLKTDNTFMTNADTPYLSIKDLPVENKNPFSQKEISEEVAQKEKEKGINVWHDLDWNPYRHKDDTKFEVNVNEAWHVSGDIYNEENWIPMKQWLLENPNDIAAQTAKGGVR